VAKAVRRAPVAPTGPDRVGYFKGVWEELRKVIWPTRTELWRMTGIVVATVVIFAALIGGADYGLGLMVKQLYTGSSTNTTTQPAQQTSPTAPPAASSAPAQSTPATTPVNP
jgi:preprotein translocase SecE subunit